jgi:hypothetical protein
VKCALRGFKQQREVRLREQQAARSREEAAVEPEELTDAEDVAAAVHPLPERLDVRRERVRMGDPLFLEVLREEPLGKKADVLGEHREETPHQEARHLLGVVLRSVQLFGERREVRGHLARHGGRAARGVERERVGEEGSEEVEVLAEVRQEDPVVLRVGEGAVGGGAVERGEEVEAMADVADDEEGRRRGKRAGVVARLPLGRLHGDDPAPGVAPRGADLLRPLVRALLGLEDEARLLVEVHLPDRPLLPLVDDQRIALEGVAVALGVPRGRVGARHAEEVAEVEQERVLVRTLGRAGGGPLRGERLDVDEGMVLANCPGTCRRLSHRAAAIRC